MQEFHSSHIQYQGTKATAYRRYPRRNAWLPGRVLRNWDSPSIIIGGVEDHVHILFLVSKNHALAEIVEEVKSGSSKWIKTKSTKLINFYWQNGYGEFSVSQSNVKSVRQYIQKQKEHHDTVSYQDEFRNFVKRHDVDYEERYVWD